MDGDHANNNIPVYHASCVAKTPHEAQDKGPLGDSDANASGRSQDAQLGPGACGALAGVTLMSHPYRASVIALQRGRLPPIGAAANRPSSHRGVVTPSDTGLATSHTTRGQETMHLTTNRGLGSRAHKNIMFRSPPTPCDILTTSPGTHPLLPSSPTPPNIQLTKNLKQHSIDHHQCVTSGSSRRAKSHGQDQMIQYVVCQDGPHSVTWCAIRRGHTWSMVGDVHGMTLGAGALAKHAHCGIYFHMTVLPHLGEQHGLAACHIPLWRDRPTQLST